MTIPWPPCNALTGALLVYVGVAVLIGVAVWAAGNDRGEPELGGTPVGSTRVRVGFAICYTSRATHKGLDTFLDFGDPKIRKDATIDEAHIFSTREQAEGYARMPPYSKAPDDAHDDAKVIELHEETRRVVAQRSLHDIISGLHGRTRLTGGVA